MITGVIAASYRYTAPDDVDGRIIGAILEEYGDTASPSSDGPHGDGDLRPPLGKQRISRQGAHPGGEGRLGLERLARYLVHIALPQFTPEDLGVGGSGRCGRCKPRGELIGADVSRRGCGVERHSEFVDLHLGPTEDRGEAIPAA